MFLYLCGALQQQRRQQLPLGEPSHPWQPAEPPEPRTGPTVQTLRQAPGRGGSVLMGVGPLANPGHAGRGAGPGAVAVERKDIVERKERRKIWVTYKHWRKWLTRKWSSGRKDRELSAAMCTMGGRGSSAAKSAWRDIEWQLKLQYHSKIFLNSVWIIFAFQICGKKFGRAHNCIVFRPKNPILDPSNES